MTTNPTLEQRIREAAQKATPNMTTGQYVIIRDAVDAILPIVAAEIASLQEQLRWIPVSERLPEYGVPVLVVYHGVVQHVTYARDIGEYRAMDGDGSDHMPESFVTHWRPLPAGPAEEQLKERK